MSNPASVLEQQLRAQLENVVFGMDHVIHRLCIGLIAGGHVLLQGVPGIGKTLLAKSVAAALGGTFNRVQCTADLMPSDITGIHIFSREEKKFEFIPGPLFASIVWSTRQPLGPKTQSALLQAMEEFQVTIDRKPTARRRTSWSSPRRTPAIWGHFPAPRVTARPFPDAAGRGLSATEMDKRCCALRSAWRHFTRCAIARSPATPCRWRARSCKSTVSEAIYRYVTDIAAASRNHPHANLGLSTRGALALMRCARIAAALRGAEFVAPDDVKSMVRFVLPHRLMMTADAALEGISDQQVAQSILDSVKVPRQ